MTGVSLIDYVYSKLCLFHDVGRSGTGNILC